MKLIAKNMEDWKKWIEAVPSYKAEGKEEEEEELH